jgi:hypothetical protein
MPATTSPKPLTPGSPLPIVVPIPVWMLEAVRAAMPDAATATVLYRDPDGNVCGIALADMKAGRFSVSAGLSGVRLLGASPPGGSA